MVLSSSIIEQARAESGIQKFVGLFSGGKDSLVACHLLSKMGILNEVLYCKTGIGLSDNLSYVIDTCKQYHWRLHIEEPEPRFSYESYIKRWGFPSAQNHSVVMGWLKWYSMRRFEKKHRGEHIGFVSGVRQKESRRRFKTHKQAMDHPEKHLYFIKPLFDWTDLQVHEYIRDHKLHKCPVYQTLHLSGDCLCGCFAELHESKLIAIFHPEMAQRIKGLEEKYGGKWGSNNGGMSMRGAMKQETLDSLVCYECHP